MIKLFFSLVKIFCFTGSILTGVVFAQESEPVIVEGIAAIVGDNVILKSDLSQIVTMTAIQQKIDPLQSPEIFQQLQEGVLKSLVDQKLVLEMAELDSIEVKDKDVDKALDQQLENIVAQAGGKEKAEEMLGQTLKSFRREFWYDMRDRLISEQYQNTLLANINTNREDVIEFYYTYKDSIPPFPPLVKLHHLLISIKPGEKSKSLALQTIEGLRSRILNGESFSDLAKTYSQDPGTRSKGGDLGLVQRGSLVKEFETIAFTLEPGKISAPVETVFGYHIIEVIRKQGDKARVRHILISPQITEEDESRAYKFTSSLRDSATSFIKFTTLVKRYSDDEKTKDIGGDLGWINPENYHIPEISQVVRQHLTLNECSPPIKTSFGYHLLWMTSIKPGGKPNLSDHWSELEMMALNQRKMEWYQGWIDKAREKVFIRIFD